MIEYIYILLYNIIIYIIYNGFRGFGIVIDNNDWD